MRFKTALLIMLLAVPAMFVTAALVTTGAVMAADVFVDHGLDRARWSEAFVSALASRGAYYVPEVPAALKALPPAERVAVVNALGAAARAYAQSAEFRRVYQAHYERSLPEALRPPRTAQQIAKEMRAEMEKQLTEVETFLKELPAEQRQAAQEQLAAVREQMAQIDEVARQQAEQERLAHEDAKKEPPDPDAMPADPQLALKRALRDFLAATDGVDYAAATQDRHGRRMFVNPAYESKPSPWKMCYRAGREACEAARALASSWQRELK